MTTLPNPPVFAGTPMAQITPFTYREGATLMYIIERLKRWSVELGPEVQRILDEALAELTKYVDDAKNFWQNKFDEFMANVVKELEALNDQAMANLIRNELSKTREALNAEFYPRSVPLDNSELGYRKSIKLNLPLQYPGFDAYVDRWGREQVPQGFAVDTKANELFIVYNSPMVVAVYNWTTGAFKTVFRLGDTNNDTVTEGLSVIYEGLARFLYVRTSIGDFSRFNITTLPSAGTSIVASTTYPVVGLGRTYCYDGKHFYATDSSNRDVIRRLDSGFADNGLIKIDTNLMGWTGELDNAISSATPKVQGFTVDRGGLFTSHGGYYQVGNAASPYAFQGIRQFNLHGDLLGEWLVDPNVMAEKFFSSGQLQFKPRVFENEGVAVVDGELYTLSFTHGYNASEATIASKEGVLILKEFSTDLHAIDFSAAKKNPIVADNRLVGFAKDIRLRIINQVTGQPLSTLVQLVEYMAIIGQQYGEYYSSTTRIVDTTGAEIPAGHVVKISRGTDVNFIIDVVGVDSHSRRLYKSGNAWIENRLVTPGALPLNIVAPHVGAYEPSYRRENTEIAVDGAVKLDASASVGFSNFNIVAKLPNGFRPSKMQYYPCQVANSATLAFCRVQTNGDIEISVSAATTANIMLTGIRFRSTVVIE